MICPACELNLETGEKPVKVYDKLERHWETAMPFRQRMTIYLICQAVIFPVGMIGVFVAGGGHLGLFLPPWLTFTVLLAFVLGTYDRLDLARNKRGQVRLTKTWRICFFARPAITIPLREYEGVVTGLARDVGCLDWLIVLILLPAGILPAIVWWYFAIQPDSYFVALAKNHGYPELTLYRGRSKSMMEEIAGTLRDVTGLA